MTQLYLSPEGNGDDFAAAVPPDPIQIPVEAHGKKIITKRKLGILPRK